MDLTVYELYMRHIFSIYLHVMLIYEPEDSMCYICGIYLPYIDIFVPCGLVGSNFALLFWGLYPKYFISDIGMYNSSFIKFRIYCGIFNFIHVLHHLSRNPWWLGIIHYPIWLGAGILRVINGLHCILRICNSSIQFYFNLHITNCVLFLMNCKLKDRVHMEIEDIRCSKL